MDDLANEITRLREALVKATRETAELHRQHINAECNRDMLADRLDELEREFNRSKN